MKKKLSLLLAGILAAGALSTTAFGASVFSDIDNVPWEGAKDYIESVNKLGLMVGDANASGRRVFRAKDQVTYCETAQLIYTLFRDYAEATPVSERVSRWTYIMAEEKIPSWAYEAVSYGLDLGIYTKQDLEMFMTGTENNFANREDVATLFGKAFSKVTPTRTIVSLTFKDTAQISEKNVPYIDLLSRLNVIVGDNLGNFNPKNAINRAEMAVVTSKSYELLKASALSGTSVIAEGTLARGYVTNVAKDTYTITVTMTDGTKTYAFVGNRDTKTYYGKLDFGFANISQGDLIVVDYMGANVNKVYVLEDYVSEGTATVSGNIIDVLNSSMSYMSNTGNRDIIYVGNDMVITYNGKKATMKDLQDEISKGIDVYFSATITSDKVITKLEAETSTADLVTGELRTVSEDEIFIRKSSGDKNTYKITNRTLIYVDGKLSDVAGISAISKKGIVYIAINVDSAGSASRIDATNTENTVVSKTIKGELKSINADKLLFEDKNGAVDTYYMGNSIKYTLDGATSTLVDIKNALVDNNITGEITINSENKVLSVSGTTTGSEVTNAGNILNLSEEEISIKTADGTTLKFEIKDTADIYLYGEASTFPNVIRTLKTTDLDAVVTINAKGVVTKITTYLSAKADAKSGAIDRIKDTEISIKTAEGKTSYKYAKNISYYLDGKKSTYDAIAAKLKGYELNAVLFLNSDQEVIMIEATTKGLYYIDGQITYISGSWLKIDGNNAAEGRYIVSENYEITLDGQNVTLSALADALKANKTLDATVAVDTSTGEITEIAAKK